MAQIDMIGLKGEIERAMVKNLEDSNADPDAADERETQRKARFYSIQLPVKTNDGGGDR